MADITKLQEVPIACFQAQFSEHTPYVFEPFDTFTLLM